MAAEHSLLEKVVAVGPGGAAEKQEV